MDAPHRATTPRSSSLAAGDRTLSLGRASEPRSGLRSLWQGGRPCCSTCRQEGTGHQRGPHWFEAQRLNRLLKIYGNFFSDASRRVCTEHPATQLWACPITWIGTRGMAQARLRNRRMEGCTGVLRPRRLDHSRCDTVWLARLLEADWWLSPLPSAASFPPLVCIVHGSLRPARVPTGDLRLVAHALVDDFAGCLELPQVGDAVRSGDWASTSSGAAIRLRCPLAEVLTHVPCADHGCYGALLPLDGVEVSKTWPLGQTASTPPSFSWTTAMPPPWGAPPRSTLAGAAALITPTAASWSSQGYGGRNCRISGGEP